MCYSFLVTWNESYYIWILTFTFFLGETKWKMDKDNEYYIFKNEYHTFRKWILLIQKMNTAHSNNEYYITQWKTEVACRWKMNIESEYYIFKNEYYPFQNEHYAMKIEYYKQSKTLTIYSLWYEYCVLENGTLMLEKNILVFKINIEHSLLKQTWRLIKKMNWIILKRRIYEFNYKYYMFNMIINRFFNCIWSIVFEIRSV